MGRLASRQKDDEAGYFCRDVRTRSKLSHHNHHEGAAIKHFVLLDVSLKETAICLVDEASAIIKETRVARELAALRCPDIQLERVGLKSCSLSQPPFAPIRGMPLANPNQSVRLKS